MIITTPAHKYLETIHNINAYINNGNRQSSSGSNHPVAQVFTPGEPTQCNVIGAPTNPHSPPNHESHVSKT